MLLLILPNFSFLYIHSFIQSGTGSYFFHTINYLVVQQHHQNIQMRGQNLMLKQILANVGVNVPLQIPYVPDISSCTNISTNSSFYITHPPTYQHSHRHLLPKKERMNELVPYQKYFMSLITILNSDRQLGRPKLMPVFPFFV